MPEIAAFLFLSLSVPRTLSSQNVWFPVCLIFFVCSWFSLSAQGSLLLTRWMVSHTHLSLLISSCVCVCVCVCMCVLSHVWLYATSWTVAHPDSPDHGISQTKTPESVVISSSRRSSHSRDLTHVCCLLNWQAAVYYWATREVPYLTTCLL